MSIADAHPWLSGCRWFGEACDALMEGLNVNDALVISLSAEKDRRATSGVRLDTLLTPDEVDDLRGIRRIERRAPELADHLPARPPFSAVIKVGRSEVVANLRWHDAGHALLVARRESGEWKAADVVTMHRRHLPLTDADLAEGTPRVGQLLAAALPRGRLAGRAAIRSAVRRGEEIRVMLDAGDILGAGSSLD